VEQPLIRSFRAAGRRALFRAIPPGRRLPFEYWLSRARGSIEPELRYLHLFGPHQGCAVDVGAHRGHYAYRLSQLAQTVVAFEINPELLVDLEAYNPGNLRIIPLGLSSTSAELPLFIPICEDRPLTGWASLNPANLPGASSYLTRLSRVTTLDSFDLDNVTFVKIDVEGHELEVLRGAEKTLARWRPTLLVEVKSHNSAVVDEFLTNRGYLRRNLQDLIGIPGSPENEIFVAAGKVDAHNEPEELPRRVPPRP
jgi:FkbM family methyltransferase